MDYLGLPGFSTCIPCFDPIDILDNARRFALSEDIQPMSPKYRGFKGRLLKFLMIKELLRSGNHPEHYVVHPTIEITEPDRNMDRRLQNLPRDRSIKKRSSQGVDSHYTEPTYDSFSATAQDAEAAMTSDALKLTTEPKNLSNVHLFNAASVVTKFEDIETIVRR
jgi:hypothetical protein